MRSYTLTELFCMTRRELFELHDRVASQVAPLTESDPDRVTGLANLRLIRRVLAHPRLAPGP